MEAQALGQGRLFSWRRLVVGAAVVLGLGLIGTAIGGFVWLHGYAPLAGQRSAFGFTRPDGVMVEPVTGSEGVEVFFPRYRKHGTFRLLTSIVNHGRFTVTMLGVPKIAYDESYALRFAGIEATSSRDPKFHGLPVDADHPIRLRPGHEQYVVVVYRWLWQCEGGQPPHFWSTSAPSTYASGYRALPVRIRYARFFEKTQTLQLPFAITLVCRGTLGSPAVAG